MILTGGSFRLYGPRGSMLADNNDFGLALNMTLPMFFFLSRVDESKTVRRVMAVMFVSAIPGVLFTYSRGALIGMAVVMVLMILKLRQRMLLLPVLMLAGVLAIFFAPEKWQHRMDFSREGALIDDSALSRFNAWTYCWRLASDYPLTGAGFDAFTQDLFNRYAPNPADVHGPHSIYFGVLAEHGYIGLFLYLTLVASCFVKLSRVLRYARDVGDRQAAAYATMLQFGVIGFLVTGAFLGRAYFDYYFSLVACTVILSRLCREAPVEPIEMEVYQEQLA
jgi:probable O-glycosylation ligase (exosortase A-associated)